MACGEKEDLSSLSTRRAALAAFVKSAMEAILLALVCLSPWAYGAVHPGFEFVLDAGLAMLLALWAVRMLLDGQITWKKSGVALCLASLFLLGVWQRTPLPRSLLSWLSPGTARCYDKFLPAQPETLPEGADRPSGMTPPGSTLSLYPGATQRETIRLLAVFLVFVVVLNNLASKEALVRLAWALLLNGTLLSLFALFQFFAARPQTVYWTIPTQATPFGPFINRNHFPDYVNVCIGLGIGLLVSARSERSSVSLEEDRSPLQFLRTPRVLWICGALGLMVSAVAFSRSRGGLLALLGAALVCGVLGRLRLGRSFRFGSLLIVAGLVVALSAWFGIGLLKDRLATLWSGDAYESRIPLWLRSLPIVYDFPVWGTGYGTFGYIEPLYRPDAPSEELQLLFDHAHNDYLEMLVEGGMVGLGLVLLALVAVFRLGYRALLVNRGNRRAGLALGTLFAFTALVLHSFTEFGAHIPAIMLLAIVVCAHLCALGQAESDQEHVGNRKEEPLRSDSQDRPAGEYRLRLGGVAPLLGAITVLGLGLVPCLAAWKAHQVDRLETAAFRAGTTDEGHLRTRIAYLAAASSLQPRDASLHYELGLAHERLAGLLRGGPFSDDRPFRQEEVLALREYVRARDACPLLSAAQLGIAVYASRLKQGDDSADYLRRAKLLTPGQSEMWYLIGIREFTLKRYEDAWSSWRHCLELSDRHLPQILNRTSRLRSTRLVDNILPDNPEVLLTAALSLYPDSGTVQRRRPFLEKALRLLEAKADNQQPHDVLVKARIYKALDSPTQAIEAYRALLNRDPSQVSVRYELAVYLVEQRRLEEADRELTVLVAQDPKHADGKSLLNAVRQEMLQEKKQGRSRPRFGAR